MAPFVPFLKRWLHFCEGLRYEMEALDAYDLINGLSINHDLLIASNNKIIVYIRVSALVLNWVS